jgi:hypothetical protein
MKNFNWYFVFFLISLPFFASANVIDVLIDEGSKTDHYFDNVGGVSIFINNPNGGEETSFSLLSEAPPLYLLIQDVINNVLLEEIPLTGNDYNLSYNSAASCLAYKHFFPLSLDASHLMDQCYSPFYDDSPVIIIANGLFSIKEKVNGIYQEPQNIYNRTVLGLSIEDTEPICVIYEEVNIDLEFDCSAVLRYHNPNVKFRQDDTDDTFNFSKKNHNSLIESLYPNPFSDKLEIYFSRKNSRHKIEIFSTGDILLYEKNTYDVNKLSLSTSSWKKGIYFIKITNNNNSEVRKVTKF